MAPMQRRDFLAAAGLSALACSTVPAPDRNALAIKVTGIEIFPLSVNARGNWVIARVLTDAGLTGLGDASHSGANDPAIGKLQEYGALMTGRSIYDIEWLRQQAFPEYPASGRATSCAVSAIDQALHDIQAQAAGVPLWALLGGKLRDQVRNYANINRSVDVRTPEGFAELAQSAVDAGFDAIKMASYDGMPLKGTAREIAAHTQLGTDCIKAVRAAIGPDRDLLVDAHSNFDLTRGLQLLKDLEPLELYWLEEVSRPYDILAEIGKAAPMPTAGGESLFGVGEFLEYVKYDPVDIAMPDIKYCGGMLELKKIAALCEAAGMEIAPHGPASPIGNMAAAQVCVTLPNFAILEYSHGDAPWRHELLDPPEPLGPGGMLSVSDRPGLGHKLNMRVVEEHKA